MKSTNLFKNLLESNEFALAVNQLADKHSSSSRLACSSFSRAPVQVNQMHSSSFLALTTGLLNRRLHLSRLVTTPRFELKFRYPANELVDASDEIHARGTIELLITSVNPT